MKVWVVCGAGTSFDEPYPTPVFLGIYLTREEALTVLKREWERVEHMIEEGEEVDEEERERVDTEWGTLEEPIVMCDEDAYRIFEWEMPNG